MIDDPSTAASAAAGAIHFPQKMRNFLRPYTPKRFAATYNQRLGSLPIYGLPRNSRRFVLTADPDISKFMRPRKTVRNVAVSAAREIFNPSRFPEPLRRSKSQRYSYDFV